MEEDATSCNACGNVADTAAQTQPTSPAPTKLPAAWLILLAGIGDIIVAAVFIVIGLIEIGANGMEFASLIWVVFGGIIASNGVSNIVRRNNVAKVADTRTSMITGVVILGIAMIYFVATSSLSIFFILIIIPDVIGLIGAQQNYNYIKKFQQ